MAEPRVQAALRVEGRVLARNAALNLAGNVLPLAAALVAMPLVVEGLGASRFGVLALTWALLGYLTVFDFGISRAATKFAAEALARGEPDRAARIGWTSVALQLALGAIGALILLALTSPIVDGLLNIEPVLREETRRVFLTLCFAIPLILIYNSFRGLLEAAQRFDFVNLVRAPFNAANFLLPALGVALGWDLPAMVLALVGARALAVLLQYALCAYSIPAMRRRPTFDFNDTGRLFRFGGWVTISGVVTPMLVYVDRFAIGAIVSMAAVGYYSVPYEVATRMLFVPASVVTALFPAFSSLAARGEDARSREIFAHGLKVLLVAMALPMLLVGVFAADILTLWVGAEFAAGSAVVLQVLAAGVVLNSLALVPLSFLQGVGRPEIPARFHLIELPLHLVLVYFFVSWWGAAGAAVAWSARVGVDCALLLWAAGRVGAIPLRPIAGRTLRRVVPVLGAVALAATAAAGGAAFWTRFAGAAFVFAAGSVALWLLVFDGAERAQLRGLLRRQTRAVS